ncbi:hypothetical protein B5E84_00595 [Lachnoclostridium sp. An14]|uniref:hypothetical protein n=1 Tax=Lachnoclostridium sp. An14 TaxID=1965562 RepID=UPI000B3859C0|nr:hypothetical protein [Lachnoclostridium sp. An14]OUQ21795.1 hypothetical protein B5E84_00595 [Lachnoclostridium sp. An14]
MDFQIKYDGMVYRITLNELISPVWDNSLYYAARLFRYFSADLLSPDPDTFPLRLGHPKVVTYHDHGSQLKLTVCRIQ